MMLADDLDDRNGLVPEEGEPYLSPASPDLFDDAEEGPLEFDFSDGDWDDEDDLDEDWDDEDEDDRH